MSEECSGYSNWETFTVAVTLANEEPIYKLTLEIVRKARDETGWLREFDAEAAGNVLKEQWGEHEFADVKEWAASKVDWTELGEEWLDNVEEMWPVEHKVDVYESTTGEIAWQASCGGCPWVSRWVYANEFTELADPVDVAHDAAVTLGKEHDNTN